MWGSDLGRGQEGFGEALAKVWLDAVYATPSGGVGLTVANLAGEPLNADILKAKSGAGELAVCSILGMLRGEDIGTKR
jgi:hypothetical protein